MKLSVGVIKILVVVFVALLATRIGIAQRTVESEVHKIDTRIWSQSYWLKMAELGLVEVAPAVPCREAVYTSSRIDAPGVVTDDSPDVPVTTDPNTTQSENSVFIHPLDINILLNSNNSTDWDGSSVHILYGADALYTTDGGTTWGGQIAGAGGDNSGDPAAAIGRNGWYYVGYVADDYGQGVAFSIDSGNTWTHVQVAAGGALLDKNHLWIDNSVSSPYEGNLYSAWTNLQGGPNYENIELARSTDGGLSWSSPINVSSAVSAGSHDQGVNIQTGSNGEVYAAWSIYDSWPSDETAIGFARSTDGGATFEPATRIIENIRGIRDTETSKNMRVNSFPVMTVDISGGPSNGTIYIVWSNIGVPGVNVGPDIDVYMVKSIDSGSTWSTPVKVNQDSSGLGKEHYFPWITCDPVSGALSVVFYDDRNVSSTDCEVFVATSVDGGGTWVDFKVSDVSFTPAPIPGLAGGYFGDYLGISARGGRVYPAWTDNRDGRAMTYVSPFVLEEDTIPPADVTDLAVFDIGSNWMTLTWTASGDDDNSGTASAYDIRYSTSLIDSSNFDLATPVPDPPFPQQAGSTEVFTVYGLDFNTTYYFAMKVYDEWGNASGVSNCPSDTTLGIPDIALSPDSLLDSLLTGETSIHTLTIRNVGEDPSTLDFIFPQYDGEVFLRVASAEIPWLSVNPTQGTVTAGDSVDITVTFDATGLYGGDYSADLIIASNDPDEPEVMVPVHLHVTGAPDIILGGPEFDSTSTIHWYSSDATTIHTFYPPSFACGDGALTVTIDGDYNSSYEYADIYIEGDSIGTINPDVNGPTTDSFIIPAIDLNDYLSDGMCVVTVDNSQDVDPGYGNDLHSVQLRFLLPLGDSLDFGQIFVGDSSVLGFMVINKGTDVLMVSDISADNADYTVDTTYFNLDPTESQEVLVTFKPSAAGQITGTLTITSDDPDEPIVTVALIGEGLEPPDISVTPDSLSDSLFTGETSTQWLTIYNEGYSDLVFDIVLEEITANAPGKIASRITSDIIERATYSSTRINLIDELSQCRKTKSDNASRLPRAKIFGSTRNGRIEETFGSWANTWSGALRDRGNVFHVTTATTLNEVRFYMAIPVATQMYFVVYQGDNLEGTYTQIEEIYISASGTGQGWYSSGPMDVDLIAGKYYYIGTSWEDSATYGRGNESVPLPTSFGTLETGIPGTLAGFPPASTIDQNYSGFSPYYQTIVTGEDIDWLVLDTMSGTIPPGDSVNIEVTFDATDLYGGDYFANIIITSNDPDEPEVIIPAHLHVTGVPDIAVSDDTLDYGSVIIDSSVTDTVIVSNEGTDVLSVSDIASDNSDYTVDTTSFNLAPEESQEVMVTFTPSIVGDITGTLTITSDDPDEPTYTVALIGKGVTGIEEAESDVPKIFSVSQNFPNPFNQQTLIRYACPCPSLVTLKIFDVTGVLITILLDEEIEAGYHSVVWNGEDISGQKAASGIYYLKFMANPIGRASAGEATRAYSATEKLLLIR